MIDLEYNITVEYSTIDRDIFAVTHFEICQTWSISLKLQRVLYNTHCKRLYLNRKASTSVQDVLGIVIINED